MDSNHHASSIIRDVYHRWNCGIIENNAVYDELMAVGFSIGREFRHHVEKNTQTRDLPFTAFMRALKHDQIHSDESDHALEVASIASNTPRRMHVMMLKDIPLSSSAKAPFGTDNNVYIRGVRVRGDEDPAALHVLERSLDPSRNHYATVLGAADAFRQSTDDDNVSVVSETPSELPRHLRTTMNPITGEEYVDDFSGRISVCSSRRMSESHIEASNAGFVSSDASLHESHRKHFAPTSAPNLTQWNPEIHQPNQRAMSYAAQMSRGSILSHNPHLPPLPYRPQTRTVARPASCPFATDADDLEVMRRRLLQTPLGKTSA